MFNLTPEEVVQYRNNLLAGDDKHLITDVGYFLLWYSTVDLGFTSLFALAARVGDLDVFDSLCGSMDLRDKIRRFRRIRRQRGGVGANLDSRLTYLHDKCRPIRNRLAHCALTRSEKQDGKYLASTLGSMPWDDFKEAKPEGMKHTPPVIYTPAQLLGWGAWLAAFSQDLSSAFHHAVTTGEFEIARPRTPEPPEDQGTPGPPNAGPTSGKPAQKPNGKK